MGDHFGRERRRRLWLRARHSSWRCRLSRSSSKNDSAITIRVIKIYRKRQYRLSKAIKTEGMLKQTVSTMDPQAKKSWRSDVSCSKGNCMTYIGCKSMEGRKHAFTVTISRLYVKRTVKSATSMEGSLKIPKREVEQCSLKSVRFVIDRLECRQGTSKMLSHLAVNVDIVTKFGSWLWSTIEISCKWDTDFRSFKTEMVCSQSSNQWQDEGL